VSARVIAVDFRARAKPAVVQETPAVVQHLYAETTASNESLAYQLYCEACRFDEDSATYDKAEALYKRCIAVDPRLAIAYTNLGNIRFRRGDEQAARRLYERALEVDPRQCEANYNLGYLLLEQGSAREAVPYFERSIAADVRFADAYYNLAMAWTQIGDNVKARPHWKAYLNMEATGVWANIAREHLGAQRITPPNPPRRMRERAKRVPAPTKDSNLLPGVQEWLTTKGREP